MSVIVGIDLGTTNSLVAVFHKGAPQLIPNVHGGTLTPSVVGLLPSGEVIVGSAARDLRVTEPARSAGGFKRLMGQNQTVKLGDKSYTAPELSSLVLRSLKLDAEAFLNQSVTEAVITVPAYFNDHQRKATRLAGEMAGFKVRRIINEPTAAALAYGLSDRQTQKKLIVIDLGGGTFDVTLMEVFEGTLEIVATAGENFLGGEDFTDRIASAALASIELQLEAMELRCPLLVSRLREECEAAKRTLSTAEHAQVRIPDSRGNLNNETPPFSIGRSSFAQIIQSLLNRLYGPIGKVLRDGRCDPQHIDEVILVGGATRMPAVADLARRYFGREPRCSLNPDEVVALGAAVQAALIGDDAAVEDMVMTDVCPHTLGVEIVKEFGDHIEQGYFAPVIHRNTTIPVSREQRFATLEPHQTTILLKVYQGEARRVKDNLLLGQLKVDGIPPGPAGQMIVVRFSYDLNGILEVEAFVPGGEKRFQAILNQQAAGLSDAEVRDAVKRLQAIKFYPRDDLQNQRLVLHCERRVGEVSPENRENLELAIDHFERAMSVGDREGFYAARRILLQCLIDLGIPYPESEFDDDPGA